MGIYTKPSLHIRQDGTKYLLDSKELELQKGKANEVVEKYNEIASLLSKYEDTRDRAKSPEYFFGVCQGGAEFIKTSRADEIRKAMRLFPIGKMALQRNIDDTIAEMESTPLFSELHRIQEQIIFIKRDSVSPLNIEDIVFSQSADGTHHAELSDSYSDKLMNILTRNVSEDELNDMQTFREALTMLWSLADKGYFLQMQVDLLHGINHPSLIDNLMCASVVEDKRRDKHLSDEQLLNKLYKLEKK
jgi:hypothetical protein